MPRYHAVMIDETGCEFPATVSARDRSAAYAKLRENYPESRVDQLETHAQARAREARIYREVEADYWR